MTKLVVNEQFLQKGIQKWRSNTNWDQDFHNRFYLKLNRLGPLTPSSWYSLVDELISWSAIRPVPKDVITRNGLAVISKVNAAISNLGMKYNLQVADISAVNWQEIADIFLISNAIKNSSTPMFGSKMCHFLLPNLFPIYDSQIGESIGTSNYEAYWMICRQGWKECTEKEHLKNFLASKIGKSIIPTYPWTTKITELCCLGGGVIEKQTSVYRNESTFDFMLTQKKEGNSTSTQHHPLKVGDVLISKLGNYHYVCTKINGNTAEILWIERITGEPISFYKYPRSINTNTFLSYYDLIPLEKVNKNVYREPISGWPV